MKKIYCLLLLIFFKYPIFPQGQFLQTTTADFNNNSNFNISITDDELKLTNDVGTGADGNLYVPPAGISKTDSVKSAVKGYNPSGQNAIQVQSTVGFTLGDEVLIITMQDNNTDINNNLAGQYEFKRITQKTATALLFNDNLKNTYDSTGKRHQVIKVPNYNNVIVDVGGILTCDDWDGTTGGVVSFRSKELLHIFALAKIDVKAKGFRGGKSVTDWAGIGGYQGESITGGGAQSNSNNFNGGGGGRPFIGGNISCSGGGGGGYGTQGSNGYSNGSATVGLAGISIGTQFLSKFFLGGAGGSGSMVYDGTSGKGGDGGGIIYISSDSIIVQGYLSGNGEDGGAGTNFHYSAGGGGGGAGGTIYLISSKVVNTGNNFLTAHGGNGGDGWPNNNSIGGYGGDGIIRIDAPSTTGTTDPPVGYNGTSYALIGTSITPIITKPTDQYWGVLNYTKNTSAPGTSIKVDVLNEKDSVLLLDLPSGTNLNYAGIKQNTNSIKLRARLLNTFGNQTPKLLDWSIEWLTTNIKSNYSELPRQYQLNQNYPNPFNPRTTIKYSLPSASNVKIIIYNCLGKEIAKLIDKVQASGFYELTWNADKVASGIYFYSIEAISTSGKENFKAVRKMMVLK